MERKIGEIFEHNGEWYQCFESSSCRCDYCDYGESGDCHKIACASGERSDDKEVHFKKLKKDGEPYYSKYYGKFYQKYITYIPAVGNNFKIRVEPVEHVGRNEIFIEIKQNKKEVMDIHKVAMNIDDRDYLLDKLESILHDTHCQQYKDEICEAFSKYIVTENVSDLKPFDFDAAKAGKPVCTRNGKRARIICFDAKYDLPIVALITEDGGKENLIRYNSNGRYTNLNKTDCDLMMLPEKRSGWAKVRKNINLYDTKEEADRKMIRNDEYVTAKVYWEE